MKARLIWISLPCSPAMRKIWRDSRNEGFQCWIGKRPPAKVRYLGEEFAWEKGKMRELRWALMRLIETVCRDYTYLLYK